MPPPDPSTLVTAGGELARWPRRVLSAVIDYFVIYFLSIPFIAGVMGKINEALIDGKDISAGVVTRVFVTTLLISVVYSTAMHGWRGSTVGKMAARTVLVMDDGSAVTWQVAFVRAVSFVAIMFTSVITVVPIFLIVNELRPLWSPKRQTWHDQIAHTVVLRA